jgi:tetratricopeptide (TPR) repeat protein
MATPRSPKFFLLAGLVLALGTLALYLPTLGYPFIGFDDDDYVTGNAMVKAGLTWRGILWAFNGIHAANWHPLTWILLLFEHALFGLHAGGYHFVNALLHTANTLLLFWFLVFTTGARWRSACVAAFFAWHPLHVESVAWISECKDVLSAFFWLLTLLAYARYARGVPHNPPRLPDDGAAASSSPSRAASAYYVLAIVFGACAMMSKPMTVTLPFALLLLDVWPLKRLEFSQFPVPGLRRLLLEKIPFFLLCAAVCAVTYLAQQNQGAVSPMELSSRLGNVPVAYARYLSKLFWPANLAVVYPYVYHWPAITILGSAMLLLVLSALALRCIRRWSWPAVGWFWFLGTLVPAIGLVQVGAQSMADRYTYLPSIGLFVVVVWGAAELCAARPDRKWLLSLAGGSALTGCVLASFLQIGYWRSTETLFLHTLQVAPNNYVAFNALGKALENAGRDQQALACYQNAVALEPRFAVSQFNLGILLIDLGKKTEALPHIVAAARLAPDNPDAQFNLGVFLFQQQQWSDAAQCFENTLKLRPGFAPAHYRLGQTLVHLGQFAAAANQFHTALRLQPEDADARSALDTLLAGHPELK